MDDNDSTEDDVHLPTDERLVVTTGWDVNINGFLLSFKR